MERHELLCTLFSHYASTNASAARPEFDTIGLNEWTDLCDDFGLASRKSKYASSYSQPVPSHLIPSHPIPSHPRYCKRSDVDRLFIAINAKAEKLRKEEEARGATSKKKKAKPAADDKADAKALDRVEFILALVHIACMKYVLPMAICTPRGTPFSHTPWDPSSPWPRGS
jgi:hypothetical protein